MALKIRLARGGAKKRPYYRIVVAEASAPRDGRFIERIGSYNPMVGIDSPDRLKLDGERAKFWMARGAKPTERVEKMMASLGFIPARPLRPQPKKSAPGAKRIEREAKNAEKRAQREAAQAAEQAAADEAAKQAQPEEAQSEEIQPDAVQPDAPETPAEQTQPEQAQPEVAQSEEAKPEQNQPEVTQSDAPESEQNQPEEVQPEVVQPQAAQHAEEKQS